MKKILLILAAVAVGCGGADAKNPRSFNKPFNQLAIYDEREVPEYTLPPVLTCKNGDVVTTKEEWEQKRRPEILEMLTTYMYGRAPELKEKLKATVERVDKKALGGKATRKEVSIQLSDDPDGPRLNLQVYTPNGGQKKVPMFLGISFLPNASVTDDPGVVLADSLDAKGRRIKGSMKDSWCLDQILEHGYGLATFCYSDVDPDFDDGFRNGVHPHYYHKGQSYPDPDEWGSVAAWAWGMSRAMDYLEEDPNVDAKKVAVIGHSRLGKTATWAGASDPRFALVISANSGCCGVAISRRCFGETVETINVRFPHWFNGNYKQFSNREDYMPFDQHELVALVAPRPIYIASAEDDNWSDQKGEFLGGKGAEEVYALYGLKGIGTDEMPAVDTPYMDGQIAYHIRKGPHAVLPYDWEQFLKFADKYFK